MAPVQGENFLNPVLACADRQLRVLSDRGDEVIYSQRFEAGCTAICLSDELTEARNSPMLGFGLVNGGIGVIELMRNKSTVIW